MTEPEKSNDSPEAESPVESLTFEEAFRRLEAMVQALESGGLALAQSTALYEEGMVLAQRCNQLLNETELKITQLKDFYAASPDELNWDPERE